MSHLSPEGVAVAAGVVAAGLRVELVAAGVVFDHVPGGALLDVHALVAARGDAVPLDQVVDAVIRAVDPLVGGVRGGGVVVRRAAAGSGRKGREGKGRRSA